MTETAGRNTENIMPTHGPKPISPQNLTEQAAHNAVSNYCAIEMDRLQAAKVKDAYNQLKSIHLRKVDRKKEIIHALKKGETPPDDVGAKWWKGEVMAENQALAQVMPNILTGLANREWKEVTTTMEKLTAVRKEELARFDFQINDLKAEAAKKVRDKNEEENLRKMLKAKN
jgi:hypothetical protein